MKSIFEGVDDLSSGFSVRGSKYSSGFLKQGETIGCFILKYQNQDLEHCN